MSKDTQHVENAGGRTPPLRRFLKTMKDDHGDTAIQTPTTVSKRGQCSFQQTATYGPTDSTKCRNSRAKRSGSDTPKQSRHPSKSRHGKRPRKSQPLRTNPTSNENNALPRVDGHCRCGTRVEAPYFERCEDCFAEDSERWSGRDMSVTTHF